MKSFPNSSKSIQIKWRKKILVMVQNRNTPFSVQYSIWIKYLTHRFFNPPPKKNQKNFQHISGLSGFHFLISCWMYRDSEKKTSLIFLMLTISLQFNLKQRRINNTAGMSTCKMKWKLCYTTLWCTNT